MIQLQSLINEGAFHSSVHFKGRRTSAECGAEWISFSQYLGHKWWASEEALAVATIYDGPSAAICGCVADLDAGRSGNPTRHERINKSVAGGLVPHHVALNHWLSPRQVHARKAGSKKKRRGKPKHCKQNGESAKKTGWKKTYYDLVQPSSQKNR